MNQKVIIAIVAVLLVAGGAWYFMSSGNGPSGEPSSSTTAQSIKDLLAGNKSVRCTYVDAESKTSGTVYVSNNKMRGDFSIVEGAKTTNGHMIVDGNTSYTWMDGDDRGFKMTVDEDDKQAATEANESVDLDKDMDYSCAPWASSPSYFIPPANVEFTDFSAFVKPVVGTPGAAPSPSTGNSSQCAVCDSVPASARAQCLASLGCN